MDSVGLLREIDFLLQHDLLLQMNDFNYLALSEWQLFYFNIVHPSMYGRNFHVWNIWIKLLAMFKMYVVYQDAYEDFTCEWMNWKI